jgi:hypothetical protein
MAVPSSASLTADWTAVIIRPRLKRRPGPQHDNRVDCSAPYSGQMDDFFEKCALIPSSCPHYLLPSYRDTNIIA